MTALQLEPRLIDVQTPSSPKGVVLVLHGGASRRKNMMVSPAQLSVLRMIPIARRIASESDGRLAVFRLLNSRRGWDTKHTPVQDARWALRQIHTRLDPDLPSCLVGHSLGGRAALLAAGKPGVRSVVALAPWVLPTDTPHGVDGKQILIVHGSRDRIASPLRAAQLAERIDGRARINFVLVEGGKHAMLRQHDHFSGPAAEFAVRSLLGRSPDTA